MQKKTGLGLGFASVVVLICIASGFEATNADLVIQPPAAKPKPVEDSMHEFMEYVFQPTYRRLKVSLAKKPADGKTWSAIKSDALILAEGGNLLLLRKPKNHADVWNKHAVAVRHFGGQFYQAARKKDYESARQNYVVMLRQCNSCHKVFAEGKYQLTP